MNALIRVIAARKLFVPKVITPMPCAKINFLRHCQRV